MKAHRWHIPQEELEPVFILLTFSGKEHREKG
jgi:hypothetical protein